MERIYRRINSAYNFAQRLNQKSKDLSLLMVPRLAARKTLLQKFFHSHPRLPLPLRSTTCRKRVSCSNFFRGINPLLSTIVKRDMMTKDGHVIQEKGEKSTTNNSGGAVDLRTQTAEKRMNEKIEKEGLLGDGNDVNATNKATNNEFPWVPYDEEDKYFVEIKDSFMKVSMMQVSTPGGKEKEYFNSKINSSTENAKEGSKIYPSDKQNASLEGQSKIPETVLQFQRQLRKTQAAKRASTPLDKSQLQIIYDDEHMVVVNKPSGVLTVPGINSNPSMLSLLYDIYKHELPPEMKPEHMIVHRLDMDTSGIVVYAKSKEVLLKLQALFRERDEVSKYYEAVVCGHLHPEVERGIIDLPLQRDHRFPPFMRVATPRSEREAQEVVKDLKQAGWKKIVKKKPKPSQTLFEVMGREYRYCDGGNSVDEKECQNDEKRKKGNPYPVTRLKLTLKTGRTHQLRVHCASIGHPILGDPAYGIYGEASANGGFEDALMDELVPSRASTDLQLGLDKYVRDKRQVMCLHARELRLQHPETGKPITFEQPPAF